MEVYPHPALLVLTGSKYRVPYKASRSLRYWPGTSVRKRIGKLLAVYRRILTALREHIANIPLALPSRRDVRTLTYLKRYEDTLDALVCAWVGMRYLEGGIRAYGDRTAAVWTP